jgi:ribulose-5-phosphate 4-epimerase/fuculose-1-phosphate aldolase
MTQQAVQMPAMSEIEWATRIDLAALYRLCVHYGWTDMTATHISARLADDPDCYLLNSFDLLFDEICASNLSKITFAGEMLGPQRILNEAGHLIHSSILKARPEINFAIHTHTRAGIAVSATPGGLQPLSQHAGSIMASLATHAYQDVTGAEDECARLVEDLGNNYAMLMENHGLLTIGRTAAEAFVYHYYLEMACKIQVDILSCTKEPIVISEEALAPVLEWGKPGEEPMGEEYWPALLRLMDRKQPDFRE